MEERVYGHKPKIYIASPYTKGDTAVNVKVSMDMFSLLVDMGFAPFCPLTTHFLHMMNPKEYQVWIDYDFEWVTVCNVLFRVPGDSSGADMEADVAKDCYIPVVHDILELISLSETKEWPLNPDIPRDVAFVRYNKIIRINPELYI